MAPYLSRRAMMRSTAMLGCGAALSGLPFASHALAQEASQWPRLSAMIDSYVGTRKVANMVAALGWGKDTPQFLSSGNTSFTSRIAAGPDTLYRIYSMTKPITGMATMMCIEDGLLSLDQPIAEILPAFAEMKVQKTYDGAISADNLEPAVRPITVRHCLTHTAGLGYGIIQQGPIVQAYAENGLVPGLVSHLQNIPGFIGTPVGSLQQFADNLARMPLVLQPGTRWSYSMGLDLMGRVIEVVSGKSFDTFLKERIFNPCGMDSTGFRVPQGQERRFTANYFVLGGILLPIDTPGSSVFEEDPPFPFGGAGIVSSPRDYDRFLMMLANGGEIDGVRVMDKATVDLATSDLLPDTLAPGGGFTFGENEFGFGAGGLVGYGQAEGLFGWFGAAGTCGLVNLQFGLRHNLMTQYMPAEIYPVYEDFPTNVAADAVAQFFRG
jgi:CubicO group peptidase (beta-lactamase class C family)